MLELKLKNNKKCYSETCDDPKKKADKWQYSNKEKIKVIVIYLGSGVGTLPVLASFCCLQQGHANLGI